MKEMHTAAKREVDPESNESVTFMHDDTEVTFIKPNDDQFILLMSALSGYQGTVETVTTLVALFIEMADEQTKRHFKHRLFSREDTFGVIGEGGVMDILQNLITEWTDRPTKSPSDFLPSQGATGKPSTVKRASRASTSSQRAKGTRLLSATPSTGGPTSE